MTGSRGPDSVRRMDTPAILNLKLEPCCVAALNEIRDKLKAGKLLQHALGGGQFIVLMAGRGKFVSSANTVYGVSTTDWGLFAQAVSSVSVIVKNRCRQVCDFQALKHHNQSTLYRFWRGMSKSFL